MKKIKRLNVAYAPLNTSFSIGVMAGSLLQSHNAMTDEYLPDRSLVPLTLAPQLYIVDATGMMQGGDKTGELREVHWYLGSESSANLIVSGQNGFSLSAAGVLTVEKNVAYLHPLQLLCTAKFYDARSRNTLKFSEVVTLSTVSSLENSVTLELDKPAGWRYDMLTDTGLKTITATLRLAGREITEDARRRFWWYIVPEGGQERLIDEEQDLFYESGGASPTLTIDARYIKENLQLRCRAEYIQPGAAAPLLPGTDAATADTTVTRCYSSYEYDFFVHGGTSVAGTASEIKAECSASRWNTVIEGFEKLFRIIWYIRPKVWNAQWRVLGYGREVTVAKADYENSADVAVELEEHEALAAAAHEGVVFTIDGKIVTL
jgi:hypothetical protein